MFIVGTAGHVDHGKSALIAALTGTNPDRWIEEQVRGMTLDLGFAHLRFNDGVEGGVIDVPGHERFLHNMLAGAAGMDVLLLVVDAGEGVMPQTLEHLQIVQFLNVRRVIVVATKIDLIEPQQRAAAFRRIAEQLQGTIAAGAPVVAVSAITGENLEALKVLLHRELTTLPPRDADGPVYLPIDRVFALPGLGTIVTGTLMQGSIATGDRLRLEPSSKAVHVRSIEVFGSARGRVEAGSRVALNVPGLDRHEVARGQAIVGHEFSARKSFRVHFMPLEDALPLVRRRVPVRAYIGSAEVLGTLLPVEIPTQAREVRAELHLREAVVAFPGVRFVVRRPSPKTLLGGGYVEVADVNVSSAGAASSEEAVLAILRERGLQALGANEIAFAANLRERSAIQLLDRLAERGEVLRVSRPPAYLEGDAARDLLARTVARLEDAHRSEPWALGVTSIALGRALDVPEASLVRILGEFVEDGRIANRGGYYATVDHQPSFSGEQRALFDRLVPLDDSQPFVPAPFASVAAAVKHSPVSGAGKAFDTMLARGALVKVGDELYRGSQIARIAARVESYLREHERMTAAEFRDLLGTSRKYAVPLLEWLDARGITIRNGDYRTLRKKPS
jgi:selenocysteine-specific elongation factor